MSGTLDMVAPTIMFVNDHQGGYWEVTYAGMVRQHRQDWQAFTFYEMACAVYNASKLVSSPSEP
jgi:mannose/cellobiose epimerase-like protein (N-acyl-D-glucosamine 2-epimerase family)